MKKGLSFIILILIACILSGCNYSHQGLDKYSPQDSNLSMCNYLLPTDDFLSLFPYKNGDYFLKEIDKFRSYQESVLLYLEYEANDYIEVKEYIETNVSLSTQNTFSYNSYMFYENETADQQLYEEYGKPSNRIFPNSFNMIAFSDENNTIVFMGFYIDHYEWPEPHKLFEIESWEDFLNTYFSFYSWE